MTETNDKDLHIHIKNPDKLRIQHALNHSAFKLITAVYKYPRHCQY